MHGLDPSHLVNGFEITDIVKFIRKEGIQNYHIIWVAALSIVSAVAHPSENL